MPRVPFYHFEINLLPYSIPTSHIASKSSDTCHEDPTELLQYSGIFAEVQEP